jgi:hypothetical protein
MCLQSVCSSLLAGSQQLTKYDVLLKWSLLQAERQTEPMQ